MADTTLRPANDLLAKFAHDHVERTGMVMGSREWGAALGAIAAACDALDAQALLQRTGREADEWENAAAWLRRQWRIEA